jgi:hypothetical protein
MLEAASNPKHPEHEDVEDWLGDTFDPEEFDLKEVNKDFRSFRRGV